MTFFFFFWPHYTACGDFNPQTKEPRIKPMVPGMKVQSPNHWTTGISFNDISREKYCNKQWKETSKIYIFCNFGNNADIHSMVFICQVSENVLQTCIHTHDSMDSMNYWGILITKQCSFSWKAIKLWEIYSPFKVSINVKLSVCLYNLEFLV